MRAESLRTLPSGMLEKMNAGETYKLQLDETLFVSALENCKVWRGSPKRNIQLIYAFNHIHKTLYAKHSQHFNKLKIGVDRLAATHSTVASLRKEAGTKELELGEKRQLADQALQMISVTMKNANNQKTDLLSLKAQTEESSQKLVVRKKAIEAELALVEPLLKEASAAVGQIKTEALSEIRSLRAPPEIIRDILEGVLRLMGIRDTSWNSMKTFLAKRGVKEDIRSLDPSQITPENCASVEKLLRTKGDSFELKNAKRASAAAAPLTQWVKANVTYAKVMQSIKPLEREQNELKRNLENAETEMSMLSTGLEDVNARVKQLSDQLNLYTQEAAILEIKLEEARKVLRSAEVLVTKLDSEYTNWSQELEELRTKIDRIELEAFLTALSVTHFADHGVADRL
jgi:dynein heavy chain 2, cytosolic